MEPGRQSQQKAPVAFAPGDQSRDGGTESFEIHDLTRFELDTDWRFQYLDKNIESLTGYKAEEFLNGSKNLLDIVSEEDKPSVVEQLNSLLHYYFAEFRIVRSTGETERVRMRGPVRRAESGRIECIQGVLNGISSHKALRRMPPNSWTCFSYFADAIEDGMCVIGEDNSIKFMNKAMILLVGDLTGDQYHTFLSKWDELSGLSLSSSRDWSSCFFSKESRLLGSTRVFEVRSMPFIGPWGVNARICLFKDVSRLKRLEQKFRNFVVDMRAVSKAAEMAGIGIFIIRDTKEAEAQFCFANNAFCKITGYSLEELLHMGIAEAFQPENRESFMNLYRRRLQGEPMRDTYEIEITRKDQTVVTVSYMAGLSLYYGNSAVVGFVRDITYRKKLHEMLAFSQKLAAIGKLSAELAHEINNPLTSVVTFNRLIDKILQSQPLPVERIPEVKEYTQFISSELNRCMDIVKNLLNFTRSSGIRMEEHDIHKILDSALGIIAHQAELSGIKILTSYSQDIPSIKGDFSRLQQAFMNILVNAVEAMPDGGVLSITTSFKPQDHCLHLCKAENHTIEVTITDSGVGIPAQNITSIFEPFFSTKEEISGVGLGLSVAYGIIDKHKGHITVQSEQGNGTCFLIDFPALHCSTCSFFQC